MTMNLFFYVNLRNAKLESVFYTSVYNTGIITAVHLSQSYNRELDKLATLVDFVPNFFTTRPILSIIQMFFWCWFFFTRIIFFLSFPTAWSNSSQCVRQKSSHLPGRWMQAKVHTLRCFSPPPMERSFYSSPGKEYRLQKEADTEKATKLNGYAEAIIRIKVFGNVFPPSFFSKCRLRTKSS